MIAIGQHAALPPKRPFEVWEVVAALEPAAGASGFDFPPVSVSGVRAGGVIIVLPELTAGYG